MYITNTVLLYYAILAAFAAFFFYFEDLPAPAQRRLTWLGVNLPALALAGVAYAK